MTAVDVDALTKLREALARKLTTWVIGVAHENAWNCADVLVELPEVADLLAEVRRGRALREAVEKLHTPVEWHGMNDDGEIDPDVVLTPFCRGCTDPELVAAVEFGDTIDQGERVIDWPCATVAVLAAVDGGGQS